LNNKGDYKMPGYQQIKAGYKLGFMDATIVYLAAIMDLKDLSKLQTYMELAQDKIEHERIECVQLVLDLLTFEEYERIDCANKIAKEVETKV